jgi:hypothetical protein
LAGEHPEFFVEQVDLVDEVERGDRVVQGFFDRFQLAVTVEGAGFRALPGVAEAVFGAFVGEVAQQIREPRVRPCDRDLVQGYPDAFYNGAANEHLMEYAEQDVNFEFWYDYLYMFLASGLEWAVLEEVKEPAANVDS